MSGLFLVKSLCSSGLRVNGRNSIREEVPFRYSIRGRKERKRTWCCVCSWCSLYVPLVLGSMAETALGRRFHSDTALEGGRSERGHGVVSVPGVVFMFLWS